MFFKQKNAGNMLMSLHSSYKHFISYLLVPATALIHDANALGFLV